MLDYHGLEEWEVISNDRTCLQFYNAFWMSAYADTVVLCRCARLYRNGVYVCMYTYMYVWGYVPATNDAAVCPTTLPQISATKMTHTATKRTMNMCVRVYLCMLRT